MRQVIVTGAARGIGARIAAAFAARGDRVGLLDREDAGPAAAALPNALALAADVSDEASLEAALERFGAAPEVFVHNAGIVRFGPLLELAASDWRRVVDVNLTGCFLAVRAAARRMRAQRRGCIVNVTSINGVAPGPNAGAYGATKAAVALLTQQMALEWAPDGLRVNAVAPGLIDAGMSEPIYADPAVRTARAGKVPLGRLGTADDVARAVLFLASEEAAYITGQNLVVDGGVAMSIISQLPRPAGVERPGAAKREP
jgi:NAD(P)-dependent dehydrogenase (short-subunit alcohol dehydrogenase family)